MKFSRTPAPKPGPGPALTMLDVAQSQTRRSPVCGVGARETIDVRRTLQYALAPI